MTSLSPPLSDDDTIMTPATIAGSDGSFSSSSSPRYAPAPHRRWSTSIIRRPSSSGIWVNSPPCGKKVTVTKKLSSSSLVFPAQQQPPVKGAMVAAETKKHKLQTRNLLKSAVHKLRKRRNKHSAAGLEAAAAAQTSKKTQQAPPNVRTKTLVFSLCFSGGVPCALASCLPLLAGGLYHPHSVALLLLHPHALVRAWYVISAVVGVRFLSGCAEILLYMCWFFVCTLNLYHMGFRSNSLRELVRQGHM